MNLLGYIIVDAAVSIAAFAALLWWITKENKNEVR